MDKSRNLIEKDGSILSDPKINYYVLYFTGSQLMGSTTFKKHFLRSFSYFSRSSFLSWH